MKAIGNRRLSPPPLRIELNEYDYKIKIIFTKARNSLNTSRVCINNGLDFRFSIILFAYLYNLYLYTLATGVKTYMRTNSDIIFYCYGEKRWRIAEKYVVRELSQTL